ncbi:MAG TPA: zf-HC2 domain-containing protein, partial [Candidatus Acidoferrales bacterium]|nr:zf-HC2 domain-containing protein [Candidatus Acidoferrales bacterium]
MKACREWKDRLSDLALGALESHDARAVEAHLAGCTACAIALRELRARADEIDAAVHQLVQGVQPSLGFRTRVLANLEARSGLSAWPRWGFAMLGLVSALVVVVAVFFHPSLSKKEPTPRQPIAEPLAALSTWRSPTDSLMHFSGEELLKS